MAKSNLTTLAQISIIAPNLAELLRSRASRLKATVTSGDAINGYGFTLVMVLRVEVLTDRCQHCGETQFSAPVFDCRQHRFIREWQQIADTAAPSLADALIVLDEKIEQWTERIERRAA